jgi:hypothetical protein
VLAGPFLTSGCLGAAAYGSHPSSANFVASARFSGGRCTDIERRRVAVRCRGRMSVSLFGSHGRYRIERLQKGRRRLHPGRLHRARLWSLDREYRQRACPHPDRVQCRHLRNHRPAAMDRGESHGRARHKFWPTGGSVRKITGSATCSSPVRMGPDRRGAHQNVDGTRGRKRARVRGADLAQAIGVKCVRQEYADAGEDEECRHDFSHSLPPCVAMPERARLRNPR